MAFNLMQASLTINSSNLIFCQNFLLYGSTCESQQLGINNYADYALCDAINHLSYKIFNTNLQVSHLPVCDLN